MRNFSAISILDAQLKDEVCNPLEAHVPGD